MRFTVKIFFLSIGKCTTKYFAQYLRLKKRPSDKKRTFFPARAHVTATLDETVVFPSDDSADVKITTCNLSKAAPANSIFVRNVRNCSEITCFGSTKVTKRAPLSCVSVSTTCFFFKKLKLISYLPLNAFTDT